MNNDSISGKSNKITQYEAVFEPCRKEGFETVKVITEERSLYLHSKYDPVSEAEKQVQNLVVGVDSVYIIFGLGLGYHIRALLSRMGKENGMLVFEPNASILEAFKNNKANSDIVNDERIVLTQYLSPYVTNLILDDYYKFTMSYTKNRLFILPIYRDIYPKECMDFASCIKSQIFHCFLARNTNYKFSDIWFQCQINNISFLRRSYSGSAFKDLYKDIPAIIVSAGPSLAKNIGLIPEAYGKAVIISVDTAYAPLYNNKITPDFIMSIDAQKKVAKKFRNTDAYEKDLVSTYLSATRVQNLHKGRMIAFSEFNHFLDACFEDLDIDMLRLESGGSVACSALDFAYKTGANPIIFVGQDLAYTGNETHIAGTAFYGRTGSEQFEVESCDGGKVLTTYNLNGYREWIQTYVNVNNDRTYLNATEGGAKIMGMPNLTLKEVLERYCVESHEISERKEQALVQSNKCVTYQQYDGFIGHFERSARYLKKIVKDVDICISLTDKMIKEINAFGFKHPERISSPYKKIKKLNKSLDDNEHYTDIILPLIAIEREEATATDHLINSNLSQEQMLAKDLQKYNTYFRAFSEKAKYAVPLIEQAVKAERAQLDIIKNDLEVWKNE